MEAAQVGGMIWVMPPVFVSSIFVLIAMMSDCLEALAAINPMAVAADAVRSPSLGGPDGDPVCQSTTWDLPLLLVFGPLATLRFRQLTVAA